jgi:hypothetical protein
VTTKNASYNQSKVTPQGTLSYAYVAGNLKTVQSSNSGGVSVTYA